MTGPRMKSGRSTTRRSWSWLSRRYVGVERGVARGSVANTDIGNPSQTLPFALSRSDVHFDEHQDRRMQ